MYYSNGQPTLPQDAQYYGSAASYGSFKATDPYAANINQFSPGEGASSALLPPPAPYDAPPELAGIWYGGAFRKPKPKKSLPAILGCIFVPFLIFTCTMYVRSMWIRYDMPLLSYAISYVMLLAVLLFAFMAFASLAKPNTGDPKVLFMLFFTSGIAWGAAYLFGNYNYKLNIRPYYDQMSLNMYPSVNPEKYLGEQLMDAGQIDFTVGSHLDLKLSYGFRNGDVYCIAPIVGPNFTEGNRMKKYDFWAVGLNCCSGHTQDFQCGEYNNKKAHRGLRLLRDEDRSYYRLAVKEAEAAYNIKAPFPVFMEWMSNPEHEVQSYKDEGTKNVYIGAALFLVWQVGVVVAALLLLQRGEMYGWC